MQWQASAAVWSEITVGQIVAQDIRKAEILKSMGIDFCCGGKKKLKDVCAEKELDLEQVKAALSVAPATGGADKNDYVNWSASFLVDYIYNQHHLYYYNNLPLINELLNKVAGKHGDRNPELLRLHRYFGQLQQELNEHFLKEEQVLFPAIKQLSAAAGKGSVAQGAISLNAPIGVMEADHEMAGELLESMASITNNFTPPPGACNSYALLFAKLKDLRDDLHMHVHLENNILFPKALALQEQTLVSAHL
ncbi:iron-sulfur cluster repair di-iron protein [Filimonas effusa]|uniref:Iron-sulfur cluster repair di-iron protein n=1 Tax=Filimonas effusa TaxID=2508721 RepID=A0A4Q1D8M7_9BACT|nr:iron-sulfur cluster repair di-iron protein [Filimonas effusa]RXK85682.1 iron-sulfur cluster repair di-iron protein [Filimonas effusa]